MLLSLEGLDEHSVGGVDSHRVSIVIEQIHVAVVGQLFEVLDERSILGHATVPIEALLDESLRIEHIEYGIRVGLPSCCVNVEREHTAGSSEELRHMGSGLHKDE